MLHAWRSAGAEMRRSANIVEAPWCACGVTYPSHPSLHASWTRRGSNRWESRYIKAHNISARHKPQLAQASHPRRICCAVLCTLRAAMELRIDTPIFHRDQLLASRRTWHVIKAALGGLVSLPHPATPTLPLSLHGLVLHDGYVRVDTALGSVHIVNRHVSVLSDSREARTRLTTAQHGR